MKKLVPAFILAALLPMGGCTVYGLGPSASPAWANYDYSYDLQQGGYGPGGYCPPGYGDPNAYYGAYGAYGYGGGYGGAYGGGIGAYAGPRGYGVYGGAGGVSGAYYGRY